MTTSMPQRQCVNENWGLGLHWRAFPLHHTATHRMTHRLSPRTALLLTIPPLLWAGNAVVGRLMTTHVPPITFNLLRWVVGFVLLLPLAAWVLKRNSPLWTHWRRLALLGLLGMGSYNALQYMALKTSTPINVTLVGSTTPVWMLLIGRMFFSFSISRRQWVGAVLSIAGVALVLSRGDWDVLLGLHLVPGDLYMLLASAAWAYYSWMLAHPTSEPAQIRNNWAQFLLAQIGFGLLWSGAAAGGEWALGLGRLHLGWPLVAALVYIAFGPALLAYRSWGAGVSRAGPTVAGFFINLTPLFTALLSSLFLGEAPHLYHAIAFVLIVGGILVSSKRS